jgi:hypothetical protein
MPRPTQISIDNPCQENWERMTLVGQSRHCAACQKTVVDFTEMDDQQILHWLTRRETLPNSHHQRICGRFHADQLNRPLIATTHRKAAVARMWQYLLAAILFSSEASAQTGRIEAPVTQQPITRQPEISIAQPTASPDMLCGQIKASDGTTLPGASITITTTLGFVSDQTGRFAIPRSLLTHVDSITISYVGFQTTKVPLSAWTGQQEKVITVQLYNSVQGDVVIVVGGVSKKKKSPDRLP